jgi:transposase
VEEVLAGSFLDELPARLIGDKAYDSDGLDKKLAQEYAIELIAPNRQRRSKSQDGRKLRRYRRRWKVERLFAWMHNFRRLVTRFRQANNQCHSTRIESGRTKEEGAVPEKSARSNPDRQRFPKWNDITQFFVRRCSLGLRKSVRKNMLRGRRDSKRSFLL